MESVWIALIVAVVTGTLSPALLLWMKNFSERREKMRMEARDDARVQREAQMQAALETIKKQTDGVISQVTALAKSTGRLEGGAEAVKAAEGTAATLALGQQQGRDAERESLASKVKNNEDQPLPVVDDHAAAIAERSVVATERIANATEKNKE